MKQGESDKQERSVAHETLIRLANSCERAAAHGNGSGNAATASDLNKDDFQAIADILGQMARTIE